MTLSEETITSLVTPQNHCQKCKSVFVGDSILDWSKSLQSCKIDGNDCVVTGDFGRFLCSKSFHTYIPCVTNDFMCSMCTPFTFDKKCWTNKDTDHEESDCASVISKRDIIYQANTTFQVSITVPREVNLQNMIDKLQTSDYNIKSETSQLTTYLPPELSLLPIPHITKSTHSTIKYKCKQLSGLFIVETSVSFGPNTHKITFPKPVTSHIKDISGLLGNDIIYITENIQKRKFKKDMLSIHTNENQTWDRSMKVTNPYYVQEPENKVPTITCDDSECTFQNKNFYGQDLVVFFVSESSRNILTLAPSPMFQINVDPSCKVAPPPSPPPPTSPHPSPPPPSPLTPDEPTKTLPLPTPNYTQQTGITIELKHTTKDDIVKTLKITDLAVMQYRMRNTISKDKNSVFSEFVHKIDVFDKKDDLVCQTDTIHKIVCGHAHFKTCKVSCVDNSEQVIQEDIKDYKSFGNAKRNLQSICIGKRKFDDDSYVTYEKCDHEHRNLKSVDGIRYYVTSMYFKSELYMTTLPENAEWVSSRIMLNTFALSSKPISVMDMSHLGNIDLTGIEYYIEDIKKMNPPSPPPLGVIDSEGWPEWAIVTVFVLSGVAILFIFMLICFRFFSLDFDPNAVAISRKDEQKKTNPSPKIVIVKNPQPPQPPPVPPPAPRQAKALPPPKPKGPQEIPCDTIETPEVSLKAIGLTIMNRIMPTKSSDSGSTSNASKTVPKTTSTSKLSKDAPKSSATKASKNVPSSTKVSKDVPKTSASKASKDVPKTSATKVSKDVPKTSATKVSKDVPNTSATKVSKDVPKTSASKASKDVPKTSASKDVPKTSASKDVPKTSASKVSKDVPKTSASKVSKDVPKTSATKASKDIPKTKIATDSKDSKASTSKSSKSVSESVPISERLTSGVLTVLKSSGTK